jgi:hypothetical protein
VSHNRSKPTIFPLHLLLVLVLVLVLVLLLGPSPICFRHPSLSPGVRRLNLVSSSGEAVARRGRDSTSCV